MKNRISIFSIIAVLLAFGLALMSFGGDREDQTVGSGAYFEHAFALDTISNANNDTLYLPARLRPVRGGYSMQVSVTRTNISGTTNIAVKAEESAWPYTGSTPPTLGWASALNSANAAAATAATTATTENINIPWTYGQSYRIIVDGTGTQSSSYRIRVFLKKRN